MKVNLYSQKKSTQQAGFTLLELIVAFFILAMTILPLLSLVHKSRMRSIEYSLRRELQTLAQKKLFDRIYTYSEDVFNAGAIEALSGTFEEEGRPDWRWEIPYPEEKTNQGEQVLLEYRILVFTPHGIGGKQSSGAEESDLSSLLGSSSYSLSGERPTFEMSTWTLPSARWYEEQQYLAEQGYPLNGAQPGVPGMGALPGGY